MDALLSLLLFIYFLIMNVHLFRMFFARKGAVETGKIKASFFKAYAGDCPDELVVIGNHMNNQFQIPIIFFVVGTLAIAMKTVSTLTLVLAVIFIVSRLMHSYVFLTSNHPLNRAKFYAIGLLTVTIMWGEVVVRSLLS